MPIKRENVFNYSNMELLGFYLKRLNPVFSGYKYLGLDDNEKISLSLEAIKESRDSYDYSNDYGDFLNSCLRKKLFEIAKDNFQDPNKRFHIINEYFNVQYLGDNRKLYSVLMSFERILGRFDIVSDERFTEEMLANCPNIRKYMANYMKCYDIILANTNSKKLFDSEFINNCVQEMINKNFYSIDFQYKNEELSLYLNEVFQEKRLSKEEEDLLIRKVKDNNIDARKKIIKNALRKVVFLANSINNKIPNKSADSFFELIEEGTLGLMKSFETYDYDADSFEKYYKVRAFDHMRSYLSKFASNFSISIYSEKKVLLCSKLYQQLKIELDREPTAFEIAEKLGEDIENIEELMPVISDIDSLENMIDSDLIYDDYSYEPDFDEDYFKSDLIRRMNEFVNNIDLTDRDRYILNHRFGLNGHSIMTLDDIGKVYKIGRERVRQIESNVLKKLNSQRYIVADLCLGHEAEELLEKSIEKTKEKSKTKVISPAQLEKKTKKTKKRKSVEKPNEEKKTNNLDNIYEYYTSIYLNYEANKQHVNELLHKEICYKGEEIIEIDLPSKLPVLDFVKITPEEYKKALTLLENPGFKYSFHGLNLMEALVIIFRYGFVDNKRYSIRTISEFFLITPDELHYILDYAITNSKFTLNENNVLVPESKNYCKILSK